MPAVIETYELEVLFELPSASELSEQDHLLVADFFGCLGTPETNLSDRAIVTSPRDALKVTCLFRLAEGLAVIFDERAAACLCRDCYCFDRCCALQRSKCSERQVANAGAHGILRASSRSLDEMPV